MPRVFVTRRARFNAAHRLHNPDRSDEWNRRVFGKCNSPNWHGHNYELEVTLFGEPNAETGYVMDLAELRDVIAERVLDKCDHANLNLDVDFMSGVLTSSENLAIGIWRELEPHLPTGLLYSVRLRETENNWIEYRGD
jgi:6-pyruvoyltetrahydropterin/6-carboxytetrahydropterin synthase